MAEPTDAEMIAWCDSHLSRFEAKRKDGWATYTPRLDEHDLITLRAIAARLRAGVPAVDQGDLRRIIDIRLDNHLCDMREGCDDSVSGFNDAWDIVRKTFAEHAAAPSTPPVVSPSAGKSEPPPSKG